MAAKSIVQTLTELRGIVRACHRRPGRLAELAPQLVRLIGACKTIGVEERADGFAVRLQVEAEAREYSLICILRDGAGAPELTLVERAVAELLCEGRTLAQIAHLRGVTTNTVKSQVRQIFRKMNVDSRVALVRRLCP